MFTITNNTARGWMRFMYWRVKALAIGGALVMTAYFVIPSAAAVAQGPSLSNLAVGTVITQTSMTLPAALQPLATGKRITYVSTNKQQQKIVVSGAIITPKVRPSNPATVAWAHGTTGLADHCAPSKNLNVFWPEAVDAVRAARHLDNKLTNKWVVSGHSQGGQAALFAGEIADTYGGGLSLKGSVAIAPVSNLDVVAPLIPGTPNQGYLVMALFGLAAQDHSVNPYSLLAQPAKDRLSVLQTGCLLEILDTYAPLTAEELLVGGALPQAVVDTFTVLGNPAQQASTVPVLLVQGTADEAVPMDLTYLLQAQVCGYGVPAYLHIVEGATHDTSVTLSTEFVSPYIQARFANLPASSNCP
jgi:fermentation-respiration switch protein FrsA (DUF1100 family)